MSITDFVLARIAEMETAARRNFRLGPYEIQDMAFGWEGRRRVLAQCAAMRKIVVNALVYREKADSEVVESRKFIAQIMAETAEDSLQPLASIWSDHPDFREEWA
jgi:hypothetical protein